MGLSLRSNQNVPTISFSYSGFNHIRYSLLAYVVQEDYDVVSNNEYLHHFLSAHNDDLYSFKDLIEHSDCDGFWNHQNIVSLCEDFDKYYLEFKTYSLTQNNFNDEIDEKIVFGPLIKFLNEHKNNKKSKITFS